MSPSPRRPRRDACRPRRAWGLPKGYLCTVTALTPITSLVENLGDGNDTGVISSAATGPPGTINGGTGDDTLVGGRENDTFRGAGGTDSVAYVGIAAASITRTAPVTRDAADGRLASTGNGQTGENDAIAADVEGLTGGNGNDTLTGNAGANTIAGSAPPGTPDVDPQPAGTESRDTINGAGGDDTLLAGDSGTVNGGDGNDTVVGGRSFANVTAVNGGNGDDTLVSGLGSDNLTGGGGSNTLAYVSVSQGGLNVVNRNRRRPRPASRARGDRHGRDHQRPGEGRHPRRHPDPDRLQQRRLPVGSNGADTILGAAPVGTGNGVVDTPAGNDTIFGRGGDDTMVGGDRGTMGGGEGNDSIVGGRSTAAADRTVIHGDPGNDTIVSGPGNDEIFGDAGPTPSPTPRSSSRGWTSSTAGRTGSPPSSPTRARPRRAGRPAGPSRTSSIPTSARSWAATATTSWSATTSPTRSSASLPRAPPA